MSRQEQKSKWNSHRSYETILIRKNLNRTILYPCLFSWCVPITPSVLIAPCTFVQQHVLIAPCTFEILHLETVVACRLSSYNDHVIFTSPYNSRCSLRTVFKTRNRICYTYLYSETIDLSIFWKSSFIDWLRSLHTQNFISKFKHICRNRSHSTDRFEKSRREVESAALILQDA